MSADAGVTLKKKKVRQTKCSKTNNEHAHRGCGFWISSIALLSWISEIREKQTNKQSNKKEKNRKPQKLTLTHQMEHKTLWHS